VKKLAVVFLLLVFLMPMFLNSRDLGVVAEAEAGGMRFGVNYLSTHNHYEPHYLSDEELDRDFALFQKQGLEYVTLCAVWKYLEPERGVYNETAIDDLIHVCNFAANYGLKVVIDFYTMMSVDSWTMPEWLVPSKFEAVFLNGEDRQAWLDFLDHCATRLNGSESIWSWNMMNEPARRAWACDVSVDDFLGLWAEMRAVFKAYSDRPVSVRFAAQVFEDPNHFNCDPRIYGAFDYLALNWYEYYCSSESLAHIVSDAHQHGCQVVLSEFGSNATSDAVQTSDYLRYLALFRSLGLNDCIAWMWRADYNSANPEPPGTGYNLAMNVDGMPRPAFRFLSNSFPSEQIETAGGNGDEAVRPRFVPDEVVLRFGGGVSEEEIAELRDAQDAEEMCVNCFTGVRTWRVPSSRTVSEWVDFFDSHHLVEFAEPNFCVYSSMVPNDPLYSLQWHLDNPVYGGINMEAAWDVGTGDSNVVVAVVDSGVAYEDYTGPGFWHLDTYNAYGGSGSSWWCGVSAAPYSWTELYGSASAPPGYGNGWKQYLQHSFDLTEATETVTLSYYYKFDIEKNHDYFFVEVSDNSGASWTQLKRYTNTNPLGVDWTQDSVDLSSFKGRSVLVRFRFNSDDVHSDEDGDFNSDGAVYIDQVLLVDEAGQIFFDDMESGAGDWETSQFVQAPDLASTSFWTNADEVPGDGLDNDGNGLVDDVAGWDFVNFDAHPNDDRGHGTHVAGTVAQSTNNNLGVAGVGFGVTVMPVKVLDAAGTGTDQWVANGIYYAVNNGADIINLSLGSPDPSAVLEAAVAYAYSNGVVVFAAAGNEDVSSCDYPAAYDDYVIAVGATQYDESKAPYSNYGSSLDIVAPGGNTGLDQNGDGYADGVLQNTFSNTTVDFAYWFYQGTSMATPHASGVAALLLSVNSTLTPSDIRNILESTAEDLGTAGRDDVYGWGLIDAQAALNNVSQPYATFIDVTQLVVRGMDDAIYYRTYNSTSDTWDDWDRLPSGSTIDRPAAAVCSGELHVVVRGSDGYTLWFSSLNLTDKSFSGWMQLDGVTESAPTLTGNGTRLVLSVRGLDNVVYYRVYDCNAESWSAWTGLPGATSDQPAVEILGDELHLVVRGYGATDAERQTLWHGAVDLTDNAFLGWEMVSGATDETPMLAASETRGEVYLCVKGMDSQIYVNTWTSSWQGWTALASGWTNESPAVAVTDDVLQVVVKGFDGSSLWHCSVDLDSSVQSSWALITGSSPSAAIITS